MRAGKAFGVAGFNRDILECKLIYWNGPAMTWIRFNRDILECKWVSGRIYCDYSAI